MGILGWLGLDGGCESEPVALTDENFTAEVVDSSLPVVMDVWSAGCQPCRVLVPTMRKLACKYDGRVKVAHLDVAAAPHVISHLGVSGTPTTLFFKDGKVIERVVGVRGQHYFEEIIETDLVGDGAAGGGAAGRGQLRCCDAEAVAELEPRRRRVALAAAGAIVGAGLGFGYYLMVGCPTGGCPLTSNPWVTTGWAPPLLAP